MTEPVIWGHQGLGDHLLCNGIYRTFAERGPVTVCCLHRDEQNVRHMLSDLKQVVVWPWPNEDLMNQRILHHPGMVRIGSQFCGMEEWFARWNDIFDIAFYEQMQIPFTDRWGKWFVPVATQIPNDRPVFVHDKPDFPINVHGEHVFRPDTTSLIFSYLDAMLHAEEIHCANSCFAAMADSYPLDGKRLFFYKDGRPVPQHKNKWTYVDRK